MLYDKNMAAINENIEADVLSKKNLAMLGSFIETTQSA